MSGISASEYVETIIIGGGQSGLSIGYQLAQRGLPYLILDAGERVGDSWRNRWDSLRLFTPACYDGLAGMPFPAESRHYFPTKDEMADFLEHYARHFQLEVRNGVRVDSLTRSGDRFLIRAGVQRFEASNVVIAMSNYQHPRVPPFAEDLDPGILQLTAGNYRNPEQLQSGPVLVVGAGNSGAEIAQETSAHHRTYLSGNDLGQVPFKIDGFLSKLILARLVLRGLFHYVITVDTPLGRKLRPKLISHGGPLIRTKRKHLARAGVEFLPRVAGTSDGRPQLEDGRVLDVANVIWCTGFHAGFSWIDLPVHGEVEPEHERGIARNVPGLYFLGLFFLYSLSSVMVQGLERDASRIADHIESRYRTGTERARELVGVRN